PGLLKIAADSARDGLRAVGLTDPTGLSHQVAHWQIGGGLPVRQAVPLIVCHRLAPQALAELIEQTRLPHPSAPDNADRLPLSLSGVHQARTQQCELPLASHKAAHDPGPTPGYTGTPLLEP